MASPFLQRTALPSPAFATIECLPKIRAARAEVPGTRRKT